MVGKGIPPRLTNRCEVRGSCMYDDIHYICATVIISYVAYYLQQQLL